MGNLIDVKNESVKEYLMYFPLRLILKNEAGNCMVFNAAQLQSKESIYENVHLSQPKGK